MVGLRNDVIEVRDSEPLPLMVEIEREYIERFGEEPEDRGGWYEPDAWRRISRVFERMETGGDVLDVGSGAGQFMNCLVRSGVFRSVTTVDPTRFNKYVELQPGGVRRLDVSIVEMGFDDDAFDVVVCMEVLEHLPEEIFEPAIAELRRVCRGQLLMTVPYREPEPISRTHLRRFEDADFLRLFPFAEFSLLQRPRKPWMLMEERPNSRLTAVASELAERNTRLERRVTKLEEKLGALRSRRSVRTADAVGKAVRKVVR